MSGKIWTKEDDQYLIDNYKNLTFSNIATKLIRTNGAVKARACLLNLIKNNAIKIKLGDKFGKLTVISFTNKTDKHQTRLILCKCDCGNEKITRASNLIRKEPESCGCLKIINLSERMSLPDGVASYNRMYKSYITNSKSKNYEFNLSMEDFKKIISNNCDYCDCEPKEKNLDKRTKNTKRSTIKTNGIDRIENDKGYTMENCTPCCFVCNRMKRSRTKK